MNPNKKSLRAAFGMIYLFENDKYRWKGLLNITRANDLKSLNKCHEQFRKPKMAEQEVLNYKRATFLFSRQNRRFHS